MGHSPRRRHLEWGNTKRMKNRFIISIDLGGTNLKLAILNHQYKIIEKKKLSTSRIVSDRRSVSTQTLKNSQALIQAIVRSTENLIKHCGLNKKDILGLGLGAPGPVDTKKGVVHFLPNIPGCKNIRLGQALKKNLGLPIYIDNDANLFTLGEFRFGAGKGYRNIIGITLGTGIGGGFILEGRLYRGERFAAGEIGHMPITIQGIKCNCGGRGCLEAYIGNEKILSWAKRVFQEEVNLRRLGELASRGNQKAIRIWQITGYLLGFTLTGVINLLNPDAIVIGGGVANAGRVLFDSIKKTVQVNAMPVQAKHIRILKGKLGESAGLIGAAALVREGWGA